VAVLARNIWGHGPRLMASAVARAYNGGLGAQAPAGSRGRTRVFNSGRLGVNTPKNFSPCPNFKTWTSRRPSHFASYYVYLSIISWKLTSESVYQCFVGSVIFADCRVSEYFISWRRATATILIYSVNSSDPETATVVLHKATKIKCCLFLQENLAVAKKDALQPI